MSEENKIIVKWIVRGVIGVLVLLLILTSFKITSAGYERVVLRLGKVNRVMDSGLNFKIPLIEGTVKYEMKTQKLEVKATSASKDLQDVQTTIALNFNLVNGRTGKLYEEVGTAYQMRLIDPAIQDSVKAATAQFNAEALITRRSEVKEVIESDLRKRLEPNSINVSSLAITNFEFSESFSQAIEAKVTAEQRALEAKNKLEQVKFEADQRVAQAEAEAEAIRIQAQAITQQGGREYVNLKWVEAWHAGGAQVPQTLIGEGSGNFLFNLK